MTSTKFINPIISLMLVPIFCTFCNGQNSTKQATPFINSTNKTQPKIVRTQGTTSGVVGCELMDKDGNLWFSISGEGAYCYNGKSFTNYTTKDGLCNNNVGAIIQDKWGNILFGTNRGICMYDGEKFKKYPVPDTLGITCLLEDKDGNLWFGTQANGVYRYKSGKLDNFLNSNKHEYNLGNNNQFILDILQDKMGNTWFSSWNGSGVWKYDGQNFTNFIPSKEYYKANKDRRKTTNTNQSFQLNPPNNVFIQSQDFISDDMIFSMTEDHLGNIWFATRDNGICIYDGKNFTTIGREEGFNSRGATAILQDDKRNFWITTADTGVWYYDGKTFKNLTESDGLVNNAVMNMLKDKKGNLWFGTKYLGLSRYNGRAFTTFSKYGL